MFYDRPFRVIHFGSDFAGALCRQIQDPEIKTIMGRRLIGSLDQFSDSTDLISHHCWRNALRRLY